MYSVWLFIREFSTTICNLQLELYLQFLKHPRTKFLILLRPCDKACKKHQPSHNSCANRNDMGTGTTSFSSTRYMVCQCLAQVPDNQVRVALLAVRLETTTGPRLQLRAAPAAAVGLISSSSCDSRIHSSCCSPLLLHLDSPGAVEKKKSYKKEKENEANL